VVHSRKRCLEALPRTRGLGARGANAAEGGRSSCVWYRLPESRPRSSWTNQFYVPQLHRQFASLRRLILPLRCHDGGLHWHSSLRPPRRWPLASADPAAAGGGRPKPVPPIEVVPRRRKSVGYWPMAINTLTHSGARPWAGSRLNRRDRRRVASS